MKEERIYGVSTFTLKLIAIITMAIDHTGAILFPEYRIFRIIGRIAFPIFCFLLVEGMFHTKNIYKYGLRLLVFAMISEIPFDVGFNNVLFDFRYQNVFFTLFIGLVVIYLVDNLKNIPIKIFICFAGMFLAYFLHTDYSFFGIIIILGFYLFRSRKEWAILYQILINMLLIGQTQMYAVLSLIPIYFYNGKKGYGGLKYGFYLFYPIHLLILYILKELLLQ